MLRSVLKFLSHALLALSTICLAAFLILAAVDHFFSPGPIGLLASLILNPLLLFLLLLGSLTVIALLTTFLYVRSTRKIGVEKKISLV